MLYLQLIYGFKIMKKNIYKIYPVKFDLEKVLDYEQSIVKLTKA